MTIFLLHMKRKQKDGELSNFKQTLQQFKAQDKVLMIFGPEGGLSEMKFHYLVILVQLLVLDREFTGRNCAIVCVKCNKL